MFVDYFDAADFDWFENQFWYPAGEILPRSSSPPIPSVHPSPGIQTTSIFRFPLAWAGQSVLR